MENWLFNRNQLNSWSPIISDETGSGGGGGNSTKINLKKKTLPAKIFFYGYHVKLAIDKILPQDVFHFIWTEKLDSKLSFGI